MSHIFILFAWVVFGAGYLYDQVGGRPSRRDTIPHDWRNRLTDEVYQYHANRPRGHNHLYESDIKKDDFRQPASSRGPFRNAVIDRNLRWEGGIVPYEVSSAFTDEEKRIIEDALRDIMMKTCIRFVPSSGQPDHIKFVRRNMGCSSYVGRTGGEQLIDLMTGCIYQIGEVQHEVMHSLGFYHEQSRSDRDSYVTIVWSNILQGAADQFDAYRTDNLNMPYDYDSIMHYGWNYFAKDTSLPTILPKDSGQKRALGNRKVMTDWDVEKINRLYECPSQSQPAPQAVTKAPTQAPYYPPETRPPWNTPSRPKPARKPVRPASVNPHAQGSSLWEQFKDNVKHWLEDHAHA